MVGGLLVMVAGHARALYGWARLAEPGAAIGGVVPGLEALSGVEAAATGVEVGAGYLALAALYAALYIAAFLLVGAALLQGREAT